MYAVQRNATQRNAMPCHVCLSVCLSVCLPVCLSVFVFKYTLYIREPLVMLHLPPCQSLHWSEFVASTFDCAILLPYDPIRGSHMPGSAFLKAPDESSPATHSLTLYCQSSPAFIKVLHVMVVLVLWRQWEHCLSENGVMRFQLSPRPKIYQNIYSKTRRKVPLLSAHRPILLPHSKLQLQPTPVTRHGAGAQFRSTGDGASDSAIMKSCCSARRKSQVAIPSPK